MPEITGMRERRGKASVFVDGEFWAEVDAGVALECGLREGSVFSSEELEGVRVVGERPLAMGRALNLLGYRARSEAEVRERLGRYGYAGGTIEVVVVRLRELGYLDDEEFARLKARETARRYGPGRSSRRSSPAAPRWGRLDPPPRGGIMGVGPTRRRGGSTAFWSVGVTRRRSVPRSPGSSGSLRKPEGGGASSMPGRRRRTRWKDNL
jgi:hypothetical protein